MHQQLYAIIMKPSLYSLERWCEKVFASYFIIDVLISVTADDTECLINWKAQIIDGSH